MRIQLMSDLHFEMHADKGEGFIEAMKPDGVDVLVLAGDIGYLKWIGLHLQRICKMYQWVIYIPGNHEYYTDDIHALERFKAQDKPDNLHFLDNSIVELGGHRFLGGTMWFPEVITTPNFKRFLNDYRYIRDFTPWVYRQCHKFKEFLIDNLKEGDIVVTHHMPSVTAVSDMYKGDPLNIFYVTPQDDLIEERKPALWMHGHSHSICDYKLFNTRVVRNAMGYPRESSQNHFNDNLILEL